MKRKSAVSVWLAVLAVAGCAAQAADRAGMASAIDSLFALHSIARTEISPDGKQVAWVEMLGGEGTAIRVAPADGSGQTVRLSAAASGHDCAEGRIA